MSTNRDKSRGKRPEGSSSSTKPSVGNGNVPSVSPTDSRVALLDEKVQQQEAYIKASKELEHSLKTELTTLRDAAARAARDHAQITAALHCELDAVKRHAARLEDELAAAHRQCAANAEDAAKVREREATTAAADKQLMMTEMEGLRGQLESLEEFRRRREELEAATQQAQQENTRVTREYEEKLGELHLRAHGLEQKVQELETAAAEQAAAAAGTADKDDADPVRMLQQNRKLAAALRRAGDESRSLRKELRHLETKVERVNAEAAISREVERAAIQRSAKDADRASAAEACAANLQATIETAEAARLESIAVQRGLQAQLLAAQRRCATLERRLGHQQREAKHAKDMWKELLVERSEAQSFLISSIRCVRRQVAEEQEQQLAKASIKAARMRKTHAKSAASQPPSTPDTPCSSNSVQICGSCASASDNGTTQTCTPSSSALAAAASVAGRLHASGGKLADIGNLTWAEREAVLRLLLAQINGNAALKGVQAVFSPPDVGDSVVTGEEENARV